MDWMNRQNNIGLAIIVFVLIGGCGIGKADQKMSQHVFKLDDLNNVASVTAKWKKTLPNSNQIFRDAEGKVVWLSNDLSQEKLDEFMNFLKKSRFKPYAPGATTMYKSAAYRVVLKLNNGDEFELIYADACTRIIIMGSGEFQLAPGCFDFGL